MIRTRAQGMGAVRSLPGSDAVLQSLAGALAISARPILLLHRAKLIGLTMSTNGLTQGLIVTAWDRRCVPTSHGVMAAKDHDGMSEARAALDAIGHVVLADLIRRWPSNARPRQVGVVTDGTGVAFSTDHPSPLMPDWLSLHQAQLCPTVTLAPFAPDSFWTLLTTPAKVVCIH